MSRHDIDRLADVIGAIEALEGHLARGGLDDGPIYDVFRVRLVEIGEAVKDIDASVLALEGGIPWRADRANARSARAPILRHGPCRCGGRRGA